MIMAKAETETVELQIPCNPKYIAVARLVAAGVGARSGLSVDDIDDLKVAVSEACTNVIDHAFPDPEKAEHSTAISLRFTPRENGLQVEVEDYGAGFDPDDLPQPELYELSVDRGLGLYLINQLTDEVDIQSAPDSGTKIIMTKRVTE